MHVVPRGVKRIEIFPLVEDVRRGMWSLEDGYADDPDGSPHGWLVSTSDTPLADRAYAQLHSVL